MSAPKNNKDEDKPPGNLVVSISAHLRGLAKTSPAVRKQFFPSEEEFNCSSSSTIDPLLEEKYTNVLMIKEKILLLYKSLKILFYYF